MADKTCNLLVEIGLELVIVAIFGRSRDKKPVDNRPDAEAAAGQQLAHAHAGLADVEAVDSISP